MREFQLPDNCPTWNGSIWRAPRGGVNYYGFMLVGKVYKCLKGSITGRGQYMGEKII